ncbi:hypothetical protein ACM66B_005647 [Microbotryomycetes sp. NB124-2]
MLPRPHAEHTPNLSHDICGARPGTDAQARRGQGADVRLPNELVQLIIDDVQQTERSQLLDITGAGYLKQAAKVNADRCRKLYTISLVSRQWHALAIRAMYEIIVMANWVAPHYRRHQPPEHMLADGYESVLRLQRYGHLCRLIHIEGDFRRLTFSNDSFRPLSSILRRCSGAKAAALKLEITERELASAILCMLRKYEGLQTLRITIIKSYENLGMPEMQVRWSPHPQLNCLVVDGNIGIVAPLQRVNVEHVTFNGQEPFFDDTQYLAEALLELAPKLRTLTLYNFRLTPDEGDDDTVPFPLSDVIRAATRLERVQIGLLGHERADQSSLHSVVENLAPTVTHVETKNSEMVEHLARALAINTDGNGKFVRGLQQLTVTSENDVDPDSDFSEDEIEERINQVSLAAVRLRKVCTERRIELAVDLQPYQGQRRL